MNEGNYITILGLEVNTIGLQYLEIYESLTITYIQQVSLMRSRLDNTKWRRHNICSVESCREANRDNRIQ